MTATGVARKTFLLLAILAAGAVTGACIPSSGTEARSLLSMAGLQPVLLGRSTAGYFMPGIMATVMAMIFLTAGMSDRRQAFLAPIFAFFQGMAMAALAVQVNSRLPGVVPVAMIATCAILAGLLVAYRLDCLPDLGSWQAGLGAFFIAIAAIYVGVFFLRSLGLDTPFPKQTTIVYWAIVCGVMVFLSYQLTNSFVYIDNAIEMGAPKWMEWVAAFGLMVALLAVYYEVFQLVLPLLARKRSNK